MASFEEIIPQAEAEGTSDSSPANQTTDSAKAEQLLDLDQHERFKWQGKEWNRNDLQKSAMLQSDYTKKTQELAEQRKFVENFNADLAKVLENPQLWSEFQKVYPKEFTQMAEQIMNRANPQKTQNQTQNKTQSEDDPVKAEMKALIEQYRTEREEAQRVKYESQIDSTMADLGKKYADVRNSFEKPEVFDYYILSMADQIKAQKGPNQSLSQADWANVYKTVSESFTKAFDRRQANTFNKQKSASQKAKDIGTGGGIPGEAPKKISMKDVPNAFLEHVRSQRTL